MHTFVSYTTPDANTNFTDDIWTPILILIGAIVFSTALGAIYGQRLNRRNARLKVASSINETAQFAGVGALIPIAIAVLVGVINFAFVESSPDRIAYQKNTADWVSQEYGIETYVDSGKLSVFTYPSVVEIHGEQDGESIVANIDAKTGKLLKVEPWLSTDRTKVKG